MLKLNDTFNEIKPEMFTHTFEQQVYKMDSDVTQLTSMESGLR